MSASLELCQSLAVKAKCLCTELVDSASTVPLMASRLIVLDKSLGVRQRHSQMHHCQSHIKHHQTRYSKIAGSIQLYAGQISGIEATVYAACSVF